nr:sensor histidine kinase [Amycolatopsis marina]
MPVVVAVLIVGGTLLGRQFGSESGELGVAAWALMLGASGVLVLRRRYPIPVAAVTLLASVLYYPLTGPDGPIMLAFIVALFTVAAEGHLLVAAGFAFVSLAVTAYGEVMGDERHVDDTAMVMFAGWLAAVVAFGGARHTRLSYLRELEQRAATEERLHIARELHDALGHNLSMINVQSAAALHRIERDPAQAEQALRVIKEASGRTLRELRGTLGVLRHADPANTGPGLSRLDELLEQTRGAGLDVVAEVDGAQTTLPREVDLAAYRLVQEALTNVTKHARATTVTLRVQYDPRELRITVDDNGKGGKVASGRETGGNGIRGMRERVRALGGELTVGSTPEGGFRVRARLPRGAA